MSRDPIKLTIGLGFTGVLALMGLISFISLSQMNTITGNSFIEVFRKNDELKRNVISIREKRNAVKEILIYNNNNIRGSFLYFNGDFDPVKVREMAKNSEFNELPNSLVKEFNMQSSEEINE